MAVPTAPVYVNDRMTYSLLVSNLGPSTATNVFLTNTLPAGFTFKTASPPQQSFSAQTLRFKLGNVANQAATTFKVTVQANSAGTNGLAASVAATDTTDPDLSNNTVASNVVVSDFLTNQLVVVTNDATQTFNPQIGLMEQGILLSNASPGSVPSVRVMVSGLGSTNWLFNAVGTNNGNPFVEYAATLDTNASVVLLLQFRVPSHAPFNLLNSNLVARGIAAVDLTPPANLRVPGNAAAFSRIIRVGSRMLMEIPSTYGRTYVVVYSTDAGFSDAKVARPSIVAPANWTYWYDYGPPATISAPMNSASRFYRIYQVPP